MARVRPGVRLPNRTCCDTHGANPVCAEPSMSGPTTSGPIALGALDLAALLCSRVCHDLISPVGAIVNGLEVLDEDKDEETRARRFRQTAVLPPCLRRGRVCWSANRNRRCREDGARPPGRRKDQDRLESAA